MIRDRDFLVQLSQGIEYLFPILSAVGVVICYAYRRLSARLNVVLIGFALEVVAWTIYLILSRRFADDLAEDNVVLIAARFLALLSTLLVVFGFAAFLADVRRKLSPPGEIDRSLFTPEKESLRRLEEEELARWRQRRPDRGDIHK
jgi:hypothetical protein